MQRAPALHRGAKSGHFSPAADAPHVGLRLQHISTETDKQLPTYLFYYSYLFPEVFTRQLATAAALLTPELKEIPKFLAEISLLLVIACVQFSLFPWQRWNL